MFKVHIVDWSNRRAYQRHLENYFRVRYEIYVDGRKWRQLERPIPLEIDAFDTKHSVYLLGIDEDGNIAGGSRLVPTLRPHVLSEVFPTLAGNEPPRGADVYEWTRFFIAPSLRRSGGSSRAAGLVLCGLLEACLKLGIGRISVVCEAFWPERLEQLGWHVTRLGRVLNHPDGDILAMLIQVDEKTLESTRVAYCLDDASVIVGG
ncbi:acyl-homoserine-lactone synthase [Pseudaminobacter soli (ex Li et al. 2025)]|uniref:Acyl-homoserine-lactone synthase n=1 Tax=Pseudaminobacter soli (ex Li et al. 2025) TaxID=1295366 RepID=A0A2P7S1B7_9HYPH|nr:acyl-homoserine-lactone synthase [Mesorhizobium soli]PSJ56242.1 autoinducer synthase [Mesorhizobium soli]